ncbi:MAG: hypothetical protein SGILL_000669, partial [Bacillariaceae sp.]
PACKLLRDHWLELLSNSRTKPEQRHTTVNSLVATPSSKSLTSKFQEKAEAAVVFLCLADLESTSNPVSFLFFEYLVAVASFNMTQPDQSGPSSLLKGKIYQSSSGEGNWHVDEGLAASGSTSEENNSDGITKDMTRSISTENDKPGAASAGGKRVINFLQDDPKEMTFARRIALSLMKNKWYYPSASEEDGDDPSDEEAKDSLVLSKGEKAHDFDSMMHNRKPSLAKAWAYFEHVALYRYLVPQDQPPKVKKNICVRAFRKLCMKGDKKYEKAEPGENDDPTLLYPPILLPHKQLGDFGLGIGLYFSTLRAITFITLVAGLISIYNMIYFASDDYLPSEYRNDIPALLTGSAICTAMTWVPCDSCVCHEGIGREFGEFHPDRCGTDGNFTFALRNDCDGTPWQLGAVNFASVIWVLLATFVLGVYLKRQEIQFDEDEQTAQDYSIVVSNPPPDAKDPDEWATFFRENCDGAHVTVCTIAVDNDLLVRTLVERRERLRKISNMQEPGSSMKMLDLAKVAAEEERKRNFWGKLLAMAAPGIPEHFSRIVALNAKVEGLAQLEYPVTKIFLTFETEKAQRHVLASLSVGSAKANRNDTKAVQDPRHLFRGEYVLNVREANEPSTVRWQDLNAGSWQRFKERFFTTFCTLVSIVVVAVVVNLANDASTIGAAFTIAIFNTVFREYPFACSWVVFAKSCDDASNCTNSYCTVHHLHSHVRHDFVQHGVSLCRGREADEPLL